MISVIIPLYNKEISIRNTLKSVLDQNFKNFEILIVNDGSTDSSINVVKQFEDKRIRIIEKENGGVSSARNLGIKEAKYDWIAFLDADDKWSKNHLSNAFEVIQNQNDVNVISTGFAKAKKNDIILKKYHVKESGFYDFFEASLEIGFATNSSSILFNKKRFQDFFFDEKLTKGEDTRFWENLGKEEKFYFISNITSLYIDDSENKAIYKHHDLNKTHSFTLNTEDILSNHQIKYYKRLISNSIFLVVRKEEKLGDVFKIYRKHAFFLGIKGPFEFIFHVLKKKIIK
ncbi:MAG: glycosyltransferase family 2 protein [Empedobacter falsenii]